MCGTIKRTVKNISTLDTQMKFYKTMAIRSGLYVCETWVMTSKERSRLQAAQMQVLRLVTGIIRRDKIINDNRNKLCIESLNDTVNK
jgi:cyclopropane fatty-acyl-phospholipid synthase-like methyltransferase